MFNFNLYYSFRINLYEVDFKSFTPTQRAYDLLNGKGKIVFNINFLKIVNDTYQIFSKDDALPGGFEINLTLRIK